MFEPSTHLLNLSIFSRLTDKFSRYTYQQPYIPNI